MAITFGGGLMTHAFKRWVLDFKIMYEMVQLRGGTNNSSAMSGNRIHILLGNGMTF
jgi:hypothetical protein